MLAEIVGQCHVFAGKGAEQWDRKPQASDPGTSRPWTDHSDGAGSPSARFLEAWRVGRAVFLPKNTLREISTHRPMERPAPVIGAATCAAPVEDRLRLVWLNGRGCVSGGLALKAKLVSE